MNYDNNGQMALGKVVSENPNAPKLRINFEWNGQKLKAGLWPMTRKDGTVVNDKAGNALYKGKVEIDDYQNEQSGAASPPTSAGAGSPPSGNFDDIPF